jgi:ribosomal protein L37AE/L43A
MKERLSQFLYESRQRAARFMAGRNGNDALNRFLLVCDLILLLLSALLGGPFFLLALALLVYIYFRMLSRSVYRRQDENSRYLRARYKVVSRLRLAAERWKQRRDYKFFVCPSCRATLRVPKGRGRIRIVCRKCGTSFTGKS